MARKKAKPVKAWAIQTKSGRLLREPIAFSKKAGSPMLFHSRPHAHGYCSLKGDTAVHVTITVDKP